MDQSNSKMKTIIYPGKGNIPEFHPNTKATFHFKTLKNVDGEEKVIDDSKALGKPMELLIGKKFKLEIWEELVKSMRIGEVARFHCHKSLVLNYPFVSKQFRKFAKGPSKDDNDSDHQHESVCCGLAMQTTIGHQDLDDLLRNPSDLEFIIELLDVQEGDSYEKEVWQMNDEEQLKLVSELKDKGNHYFKEEKYDEAANCYEKANAIIDQLLLREKPGEDEWHELDQMKIPFLSNLAQCRLNLQDHYQAIKCCDEVLQRDASNVKAFFRRAKANLAVSNFDEAKSDFEISASLEPYLRPTVNKFLVEIERQRKSAYEKEKTVFSGKLFS